MTSHHSSDESLVDDLRAGRPEAFRRLYDEQHPAIYNLCARILGDREEAKDVTQETFITAFSNPPAADPSLKLRAWLYRVATNACFNQLRARKQIGGGDGMVGEIPAPVDEFARAETVAAVEQTLGQMNERYRTALVLKDLHGLPPEEIAAVMEVSRPTADVLVHRARASFKTAFAKLGGDVPAPASLGLVLAPLAVPAALHIMPPLPHVRPARTSGPAAPRAPRAAAPHRRPPQQARHGRHCQDRDRRRGVTLAVGGGVIACVTWSEAIDLGLRLLAATAMTSLGLRARPRVHRDHDRTHDDWGHHWRRTHDWYEHTRSGDTWSGDHWASHDSARTTRPARGATTPRAPIPMTAARCRPRPVRATTRRPRPTRTTARHDR